MRKLASILAAATVGAGLLTAAAPASATEFTIMSDRCVQTIVTRTNSYISAVTVKNVCNETLPQVNVHAFNGPAHFDKSDSRRWNLGPGQIRRLPATGTYGTQFPAPAGSLTCGELWGPAGAPREARPYGTDCIRM